MKMPEVVYTICAVISLLCTSVLFMNYRRTGSRLLLWVTVSFVLLSLNNVFACVDLLLLPDVEMSGSLVRNFLLALAGTSLSCGIAWEIS
jgi:hypothetical protein